MITRLVFPLVGMALAAPAWGQYRVGPEYPQKQTPAVVANSGQDPFQLNWYSGRFEYVPGGYAAGAGGGPYQFNSYTGRWVYAPVPPPMSPAEIVAQSKKPGPPAEQAETAGYRVGPTAGAQAFPAQPQPAGQAPLENRVPTGALAPLPVQQRPAAPTTRKSLAETQPAGPSLHDPLNIDPQIGRWEYNDATGKWMHILPGD